MKQQPGNFIVMFRPGVVTGLHSEREVKLRDICDRLGGFDCKVFDPYMTYASFADAGRLVRVEQVNAYGFAAAAFFYPDKQCEHKVRREIINSMLDECKDDPKLILHGYVIVSDSRGNLRLKYVKRPDQINSSCGVRKVDEGAGY